jgi:hypothetical protein
MSKVFTVILLGLVSVSSFAATSVPTLEKALQSQVRVDFIEAQNLQVTDLLPDDTNGSPHQKFVVKVTQNSLVTIISNLDMCPHVPVRKGDLVAVGGQFIPTGRNAGIIHWTHRDPKHKRTDGYIQLGSQTYCK